MDFFRKLHWHSAEIRLAGGKEKLLADATAIASTYTPLLSSVFICERVNREQKSH